MKVGLNINKMQVGTEWVRLEVTLDEAQHAVTEYCRFHRGPGWNAIEERRLRQTAFEAWQRLGSLLEPPEE